MRKDTLPHDVNAILLTDHFKPSVKRDSVLILDSWSKNTMSF